MVNTHKTIFSFCLCNCIPLALASHVLPCSPFLLLFTNHIVVAHLTLLSPPLNPEIFIFIMSRRVRRKVEKKGKEQLLLPNYSELITDDNDDDLVHSFIPTSPNSISSIPINPINDSIDWTTLPDDTVIQLFSLLNYRDRASLASSCKTWRNLGSTPCLWESLDLRAHRCDAAMAASLSSRCFNLRRLRFLGAEFGDALIYLKAKNLRELAGDYWRNMTDATLSVIAARHEMLESIQLGPDFCERITSDAIRAVAICCPRLRRLVLSGVREIDADALNALAKNCVNLCEIGFLDCLKVDETALGGMSSIRFLSVAGTSNLKWGLVSHLWSKLPNLVGLDVSRTDIGPTAISRMLLSCKSMRVLCALNCTNVEEDANFVMSCNGSKDKLVLSLFSDICKGVGSLFADNSMEGRNVFLDWRDTKSKEKKLYEIMIWLEWVLSYSLLRIAESNPSGLDNFWVSQGATLLLSLMQSSQEDVQERSATGLATFVVIDDEHTRIDGQRAAAVMRGGGVQLLLKLASSWREGLQAESAKV